MWEIKKKLKVQTKEHRKIHNSKMQYSRLNPDDYSYPIFSQSGNAIWLILQPRNHWSARRGMKKNSSLSSISRHLSSFRQYSACHWTKETVCLPVTSCGASRRLHLTILSWGWQEFQNDLQVIQTRKPLYQVIIKSYSSSSVRTGFHKIWAYKKH